MPYLLPRAACLSVKRVSPPILLRAKWQAGTAKWSAAIDHCLLSWKNNRPLKSQIDTFCATAGEKKNYIHETKMVASMGEMDVAVVQVAIYRNNLTAYLLLATELTEK